MSKKKHDLREIKSQLDLTSVVEQTTGQQVPPRGNLHCPFHDDRNPSMHIYPDGRFKCFSPGCPANKGGDVLDWLGLLFFGSAYDPRQHLAEVIDRVGTFQEEFRIAPASRSAPTVDKERVRPSLDPNLGGICAADLKGSDKAYLKEVWGISLGAAFEFQVGRLGRRWTFPWYYRGVLTAIKTRRDDRFPGDGKRSKYDSVPGSRYAAPFNVDALSPGRRMAGTHPDTVLICEDEKSVICAWSYGYTALALPAGWANRLETAAWGYYFAGIRDVVVVADWGEPGQAAAEKFVRLLGRGRVVRAPRINDEVEDLADWHAAAWDRSVNLPDIEAWLFHD